MWAIYHQIYSGRYKATLMEKLPSTVRPIVSEINLPAGLDGTRGVVHIDGKAGNWGTLVIILPKQGDESNEEEQKVEAGPLPTGQTKGDGETNLGQLLRILEGSELAFVANSRLADHIEAQEGGIAAHWWRIQAAAQKFQPDPTQMPGIDRIEILCDELARGTGLTATNVRQLRARLCRLKRCSLQEADAYSLGEVADALEQVGAGPEGPADQTMEPMAGPQEEFEALTQPGEVPTPTPLPPAPEAVHNTDFTMVNWFGTEYHFALGVQSSAVRALWEEWKRSGLGLHQETIREAVDPERDSFRMDVAFRNHPALRKMIQRCGDGRYKLAPLDTLQAPSAPKKSAKNTPKTRQKRG